ncbi:unnamed protein product [Protopolystoma xenopodis]|uniref:Uncharacterized protein n=1 Tax=Protopolystoma xenopodis TaxID=117903 RepID=A0A3S5BKL6_9PLAT|nr:unnamed protein product [Protopolystoma xenopodis]
MEMVEEQSANGDYVYALPGPLPHAPPANLPQEVLSPLPSAAASGNREEQEAKSPSSKIRLSGELPNFHLVSRLHVHKIAILLIVWNSKNACSMGSGLPVKRRPANETKPFEYV